MLKVLDIGAGTNSLAEKILGLDDSGEEYDIFTLDINPDAKPDIIHDITKPLPQDLVNEFDLVICSHVLEHIDRDKLDRTFGHITEAVKNMGELWVLVPSMEWAAAEILANRHTLAVEAHMYGKQDTAWEYHRCGFTLRMLRVLFESHNLLIKKAYQSPYVIAFGQQQFRCIQNIAIGARYDGFENPALAIG